MNFFFFFYEHSLTATQEFTPPEEGDPQRVFAMLIPKARLAAIEVRAFVSLRSISPSLCSLSHF